MSVLLAALFGGAAAWTIAVTLRRSGALSPSVTAALLASRLGLLAVVALAVISPARTASREEPLATSLSLLVDVSESMAIADEDDRTRLRSALGGIARLQEALGPSARCAIYAFADRPRRVRKTEGLQADGPQTRLWEALEAVGTPDAAAIVAFTDGRDTTGAIVEMASASRKPVFCVGLGQETPPPDVRLLRIIAPRVSTARQPLSIAAELAAPGLAGKRTRVVLRAEDRVVASREVDLSERPRQVRLSFIPQDPGVVKLTLEAKALPGEHTDRNNVRHAFVRLRPPTARLLYLDRGPDRDYAPLRRLLVSLEHMELTIRLRKADGGPWWREWPLPLQGDAGPATGDLRRTDGFIVGDLAASDLPAESWRALGESVARHGAGLLLLAGERSHTLLGEAGPLRDLLPAQMGRLSSQPLRLSRRDVTGDRPWGPDLELPDGARWEDLPFLPEQVISSVAPTSRALLHSAEGAPVLIAQRAGAGRCAVLLARGWHRWQFSQHATPASRAAYDQLFSGLARWLVQRSNDRPVRAILSREVCAEGEIVRLAADVVDEAFEPVPDATVTGELTGAEDHETVVLTPVGGAAGRYEAALVAPADGTYQLKVEARREGQVLGRDELRLVVEPRSAERERPEQNVALLRELADATGGRYFRPDQMDQLAAALPRREKTALQWVVNEPWRSPWALVGIVLLASLDWGLRRRWHIE